MKKKPTVIEADNVQIKIYIDQKARAYSKAKAVIRIDEDIYDELVALSNETRLSICDLASEMLRFAKDKTAVIERTVCLGRVQDEETVNTTTPQTI